MNRKYLTTIFNQMLVDTPMDTEMTAAEWLAELGACMLNNLEIDENETACEDIIEIMPCMDCGVDMDAIAKKEVEQMFGVELA